MISQDSPDETFSFPVKLFIPENKLIIKRLTIDFFKIGDYESE